MVAIIVEVLYSCQTIERKLYLDLAAYIILWESFHRRKRAPGDLLMRSEKRLFSLKQARKGFFGCYSVCETMKDTKEGYFIV